MVELDVKKAKYLVGSIATMRDKLEEMHEEVEGIVQAAATVNNENPEGLKKLQKLAGPDVFKKISKECNDIIVQCNQTLKDVFNEKV